MNYSFGWILRFYNYSFWCTCWWMSRWPMVTEKGVLKRRRQRWRITSLTFSTLISHQQESTNDVVAIVAYQRTSSKEVDWCKCHLFKFHWRSRPIEPTKEGALKMRGQSLCQRCIIFQCFSTTEGKVVPRCTEEGSLTEDDIRKVTWITNTNKVVLKFC